MNKSEQLKFQFQTDVFEMICAQDTLRDAFKAVKRNKGAPGIDGITIEMYEESLEENLIQLRTEVKNWLYKPTPVKRVEIPKLTGKGVRLLGIPIIKDRVLHMAIKMVLEPILEPTFSENSFGFRPGRNQQQAVLQAQKIVQSGKEYVVDIDLSKFFDRINHDRLIYRLKGHIKDSRVLRLIGMILRGGIMIDGIKTPSEEGSVQGSPLSPLLSNVVLDELDKELEKRNLEFCRFADDCAPRTLTSLLVKDAA
jgi:RNA-directed DNA polymerase